MSYEDLREVLESQRESFAIGGVARARIAALDERGQFLTHV
jgi:hypothetical protein